MRSFSGGDQLNHFLRTAEPILNHASVSAQGFYGELSSNTRLRISGIFGHKPNFIEPNSGTAAEICFEAFGKAGGIDSRLHESADASEKVFARHTGAEADACHACVCQQIGEIAFSGSGFKGHAIEQKLRSGRAQQKPSFA